MINIFVSYSHKNAYWLDRNYEFNLIPFLEDSLKWQKVKFWYDNDLRTLPGIEYEDKINEEIDKSQLAILLLSRDFINSSFIMEKELPKIKARLEENKINIIPILVEPWTVPVNHPATWLIKTQIIPGMPTPLINFTDSKRKFLNERNGILQSIERIIDGLKNSSNSDKGVINEKSRPKSELPSSIKEINKLILKGKPVNPPPSRWWRNNIRWIFGLLIVVFSIFSIIKFDVFNKIIHQTEINKDDLPLSRDQYRSKVLAIALLLKTDPMNNAGSQIKKMKELNDIVKEFTFYEKEMPTETAILKRLYGATIILTGQDPKKTPKYYFKKGIPYIKKSYSIEQEIWKNKLEKEAYDFLIETEKNIDDIEFNIDFIQDYLKNVITVAMFSASQEEINEQVKKIIGEVGSTTDVLTFFNAYPVGNTNYRLTVEAIKMLLIGMGAELNGPEIIKQTTNIYQIKYWLSDANGQKKYLIWKVDMNKKSVVPENEHAKTFTNAIKNRK